MMHSLWVRCGLCAVFVFGGAAVVFGTYRQEPTIPDGKVEGVVIPHHDVVRGLRGEYLKSIFAERQPHTVILVSPNHFNTGSAAIIPFDGVLRTSSGDREVDRAVIDALHEAGYTSDASAFEFEHGISSPLADIAKYAPRAQIVPIIIKTNVVQEDVEKLAHVLHDSCVDCLMVASVDFSHYQTPLVADIHDARTLRALASGQVMQILNAVEVDSPQSLALLTLWSHMRGAPAFTVAHHTNSGFLIPGTWETTTHVMASYRSGEPPEPHNIATFALLFDVPPRMIPERQEFIDRFMSGVDMVLGPRETTATNTVAVQRFAYGMRGMTAIRVFMEESTYIPGLEEVERAVNQNDHVMVLIQTANHSEDQISTAARAYVDAGADLVAVVSSSSVLSRTMQYRGRPIIIVGSSREDEEAFGLVGMWESDALRVAVASMSSTTAYDTYVLDAHYASLLDGWKDAVTTERNDESWFVFEYGTETQ